MKVWATFKEGTRLYRAHFGQLFVLNAVTFLPAAIIAFAVSREAMPIGNSRESIDRWAALTAALVGAMMLWSLVSTATLHYAVGDAYQTGRCNWRESLRRCRPRLLVFAGTMGVLLLAAIGLFAITWIVGLLNQVAGLVALVLVVLVGSIGGTTYFTILVPVVVREDVGVRTALTRTWELVRPKLPVLVSLLFVSGFIIGICSRLMAIAIEGGFEATVTQPTQLLVAIFVSIVVPTLVFTPWTVSVVTMAYIRLREDRGESLDDAKPSPTSPSTPKPASVNPTDGQVAHSQIATSASETSRSLDGTVLALLHGDNQTLDHPTPARTHQTVDDEIFALLRLEGPPAAEVSPAAEPTTALDEQVLALISMDSPQEPVRSRPRWSEPLGSD